MTPRERVLTALSHREPDKVPIDFGATQVTTITRIAYQNLREYLGLGPDVDIAISDRTMDSVYPKDDFFERYAVDFRAVHMSSPWGFKNREMPDDSFYDEFNIRWKKVLYYYDAVERPLAKTTLADLDKAAWPDPSDPGRVEGVREKARRLFETTDYAILADIMCGGPFEQACMLRGYDQFCIDLHVDPQFATALLEKITDTDIALWDAFLNAVGDYVQIVAQGDDVGMQSGPFMSPAMYRKFIKPCHKRLFDFIHSKTKAKVFLHSCGSVYDLIPDLIDAGVDVLNPLQTSAAKMDLVKIKQEFGKDLCFWGGGIDVQRVLPFASLDEIKKHVTRVLDIMAPGGGYVFVPAHNIQADIAPQRIDKVYETALRHRDYAASRHA